MFACEHEQVTPDILCLGKGITAGYLPVAATLATDEVFSAFLGTYASSRTFFHGHTYGGNPLGCAVGLASLDVFEEERTLERLAPKIDLMRERLLEIAGLPHVGHVRQCGFIAAIELVRDVETREPFPWQERRGYRVCEEALRHGVWIRPLGNVIIVMPPLSIATDDLDAIFDAVEYGIAAATRES
jgi:adenosylmethionine-8-amino-7-oxononanoate aminotransferase